MIYEKWWKLFVYMGELAYRRGIGNWHWGGPYTGCLWIRG